MIVVFEGYVENLLLGARKSMTARVLHKRLVV